jgi:hypothetical protein
MTCSKIILITGLCLAGFINPMSQAADVTPPPGFKAIFNGKDLSGWHGMDCDPRKFTAAQREKDQKTFLAHWSVENAELVNDGNGAFATTDQEYTDIELLVDYKTVAKADSGIYLRASPQVQIWDFTKEGGKWDLGADKGSGGLWNNTKGNPGKDPLVFADKPFGQWNHLRIIQVGARTTVWLNDKLVVDNAIMENYWDRKLPLFAKGPVQLQTHGNEIRWRNIFLREIPADEATRLLSKDNTGFKSVFNGKDFDGWAGPTDQYEIKDGAIACKPGKGGTIYTKEQYTDFVARVEFKLPPAGNNGLAIRYPGQGDGAYEGMCELQILDDTDPKNATNDPRQYNGSAYGMVASHRGYLRPLGEWNYEEVTVKGSTIKVELNGTVILDTDLSKITSFMNNTTHPGKDRTFGYFGFAGHNDPVMFRNISIKKL